MEITLINESKTRWPKKFVAELFTTLEKELKKRKVRNYKRLTAQVELTLIFLPKPKAKKINKQYRNKNYATDVLSFLDEGACLGELALCPEVIAKQAKDHGLTFNQELAYMIIHGVLHLLGYDHELNKREGKIMLEIQDEVFDKYQM